MESAAIHIGIYGDRLDAHLATGTNDANRYFTAVCDQDSFEHEKALPSGRPE
jgi:hypothetical protein